MGARGLPKAVLGDPHLDCWARQLGAQHSHHVFLCVDGQLGLSGALRHQARPALGATTWDEWT
eukprot:199875-Alexandrium_andersonii.AAC.1